jgi:DNA-binding LytR/AlgR family response regulator
MENSMRILIVEDQEPILLFLTQIIQEAHMNWTIDGTTNFDDALAFASSNSYHLFIIDYELDIENTDKNGLNLGMQIRSLKDYDHVPMIFETSYAEHIFDVVNNLNCIYYLTKPYTKEQVLEMLQKVSSYDSFKKKIQLKDDLGILNYLYVEDIIYAKSNRHSIEIVLPETTFICPRYNLGALEEDSSGMLIRCHKSYLINRLFFDGFEYGGRRLSLVHPRTKKGYSIPYGKKYATELQTL